MKKWMILWKLYKLLRIQIFCWKELLKQLGASLLGNLLTGKGIVRARSGNNKGKGIGYGNHSQNKMDF